MIAECLGWLERLLRDAQVERVYRSLAALDQTHPLPFAVLVLDRERLTRDGSRVAVADRVGCRALRRRLWQRRLPVRVVVEHRTDAAVEGVLEAVLSAAREGPADDGGNRYRVRATADIVWDQERSATAERCRATLALEFEGGVYRDDEVPLVGEVAPEPDGE